MQKNLRYFIRAILIVLINVIFRQVAFSQVPLPGDCLGAYTVCSISFNQTASFNGEGNYLGEVNSSFVCFFVCLIVCLFVCEVKFVRLFAGR